MVARGGALDHGRRAVLGEQPREQDGGLQLRARDRQLVADRPQPRAFDHHRRPALVRLHARAHLPQRLVDAHRARRERLVADELEAAVLSRQDPAEQAEHGAGVAAIDRSCRRNQPAQAAPPDPDGSLLRLAHFGAERAHRLERRVGVRGVAEVPKLALAVRDRRE